MLAAWRLRVSPGADVALAGLMLSCSLLPWLVAAWCTWPKLGLGVAVLLILAGGCAGRVRQS